MLNVSYKNYQTKQEITFEKTFCQNKIQSSLKAINNNVKTHSIVGGQTQTLGYRMLWNTFKNNIIPVFEKSELTCKQLASLLKKSK